MTFLDSSGQETFSINIFYFIFKSNKRSNGWTDRVQSFCGTSHSPRKFWNPRHFLWNPRTCFLFCFTMYTKRKCIQLKKKISAKRIKGLLHKQKVDVLLTWVPMYKTFNQELVLYKNTTIFLNTSNTFK